MNEKNKPVKKIKVGLVQATIWENKISIANSDLGLDEKTVFSIDIVKNYKDKKSGEWKTTNSYGINDLPKVVAVTNKAYEFIALKESE